MPGGAKPGQRFGGRAKGTPNRTTIERAVEAERAVARARDAGKPLAKEVLERFMLVFASMAQQSQEGGTRPDPVAFEKWALHAVDAARALAPYQSPTMRAIVVAPAPDQNQAQRVTRFSLSIFNHDGTQLRQLTNGAAKETNGKTPPPTIDG